MTPEERLARRKEFRKYLRTREGISGSDLNAVMQAAEQFVPTLIEDRFLHGFVGLYEETLDLSQFLALARRMERDEQFINQKQGYTCFRAVVGYARYFADRNGLDMGVFLPPEADYPIPDEGLPIHEGREYEVRGIRYERDRNARTQCIDYYKSLDPENKCRCQVCKMCFEEVYGEIGKDFIEVHHLVPISERGGDYIVNPVRDLVPLCSNCHSMIHSTSGGRLTLQDLMDRIARNR